ATRDSSRSKTRFGAPSPSTGVPSSSTTLQIVSPSEIVPASTRVTGVRDAATESRARFGGTVSGRGPSGFRLATPDQLDAVVVRVPHEADPGSALADLVGRALRLDLVALLQGRERRVEIVDPDRD